MAKKRANGEGDIRKRADGCKTPLPVARPYCKATFANVQTGAGTKICEEKHLKF